MILDVDGNVVSVETLVNRVENLIGTLQSQARNGRGAGEGGRRRLPLASVSAERALEGMRLSQAGIQAPVLSPAPGLRSKVVRFVKRVVRKLTRWYVEPRWDHQRQFDQQAVDLAGALLQHVRRVESEVVRLQERNSALELALAARWADHDDADQHRHGTPAPDHSKNEGPGTAGERRSTPS